MKLNSEDTKFTYYLLAVKLIVLVTIGILLYEKLKAEQDILKTIGSEINVTFQNSWFMYLIVILLMPVNWLVEALKWKFLVKKLIVISWLQAYKGVLSGLTIGFASPHGVGDYFGRIMSIEEEGKEQLVGSLLIGRVSQMLATALFGSIGLGYLFGFWWVFVCVFITLCCLIGLAFLSKQIHKLKRIKKYIQIINQYTTIELSWVLMYAVIRYIIFSLQFLIILKVFLPELDVLMAYAGSTYIFLSKSILPSFNFLSDLGIREYSAIYFFEKFNIDILPIISASLMLWIINILIPTLVGIPGMLQLKWKS